MSHIILEIISSRKEMIEALVQSRLSRSIIGLKSQALGPGTYFTSVQDLQLREDGEVSVRLQGYDMTGYFLDKSEICLSEIDHVIPLTALFENPFLRDLRKDIIHQTSFSKEENRIWD